MGTVRFAAMERPAPDRLATAAGLIAALSAVATPLLVFLGAVPEDAFRRLVGDGFLANFRAAILAPLPEPGGWSLVLLGALSFAAGLLSLTYLARGRRPSPERAALALDAEHLRLHEEIHKDYNELRQQIEDERGRGEAAREELLRHIETMLKQVATIERMETERGELMAAVQKMLDRVAEPGKLAPREATGDRRNDAMRKSLDEIRRELGGEK
jgi:hypothetical protein